ncbi:MAG TPA: hypothetical protein PLE33_02870 [Candidatus Cloacimonas sp.]|nr:hypothetical protein [Candidatus Cloacimonas sp.]HPS60187.1 hypothetical protein [Candidatus Cloacimonas sp.]
MIIGRDEQGKRDLIENELGEMARWKERDSEIDFFYKEKKRERDLIENGELKIENELGEMARWRDGKMERER